MLAFTVKWKFMCKTLCLKGRWYKILHISKIIMYVWVKGQEGGDKYTNIIRSHPWWYMLSPRLAISLTRKRGGKINHKSTSLHYTDNTIQYLYFPVISYHGAVCKHGCEGTSSMYPYTGMQNKYCLLQHYQENNREHSHISFKYSSTPRAAWQFQF